MPRHSAGLLLYRLASTGVEVLIAHPGGPYWAHRDDGSWSIPKGECADGEDLWATAQREFAEETGMVAEGDRLELGTVQQSGGKLVTAFAVRGDMDASAARSNTFTMEWPPRSGRQREFPEVDRVAWFGVEQAKAKLLAAQREFVDRLLAQLAGQRRNQD